MYSVKHDELSKTDWTGLAIESIIVLAVAAALSPLALVLLGLALVWSWFHILRLEIFGGLRERCKHRIEYVADEEAFGVTIRRGQDPRYLVHFLMAFPFAFSAAGFVTEALQETIRVLAHGRGNGIQIATDATLGIVMSILALCIVTICLWHLLAQESIRLRGLRISVARGVSLWTWRTELQLFVFPPFRVLAPAEREQDASEVNFWDLTVLISKESRPAIAFDYMGLEYRCGLGLNEIDAKSVVQWLNGQGEARYGSA